MKKILSSFILAAAIFSAGADAAKQPDGAKNPGEGGFFGTVPNEEKPELSGKISVKSGEKSVKNEKTETGKADESAVYVGKGASASVVGGSVVKKGDSSNDGQSNFYGLNAAVLSDNGKVTVRNLEITTDGDGANAVFSTGSSSVVSVKNVKIHTKQNSSRGLDSTYGGKIEASGVEIVTEGEHCAAFATDRGEGFVTVDGGKASTNGKGSPVIYSTGDIRVSNLKGSAKNSEIACIEGKNSISISKGVLSGGSGLDNEVSSAVMLYQSMSGDANRGTASFTSSSSTLTNTSSGPFFYVTNTSAKINLDSTKLVQAGKSKILLQASGNNSERGWGRKGANGGQVELAASSQTLSGEIVVDKISSAKLNFGKKTTFTGTVNAKNEGSVDLVLDSSAKFIAEGNCYFDSISDADGSYKNIVSNGYIIYYNKNDSENSAFHGRTILLNDGGKLAPYERVASTATVSSSPQDERGMTPPPDGKADGKGPKMDFASLKGTLCVVKVGDNSTFTLLDENNKATVLKLMDDMGGKGGKGGMGERNGPPPSDFGNGGQPPSPPSGDMKNGGGKPEMKGMPKPVTESDLRKLNGKTVEIKGVKDKDGKFTVFEIKEAE